MFNIKSAPFPHTLFNATSFKATSPKTSMKLLPSPNKIRTSHSCTPELLDNPTPPSSLPNIQNLIHPKNDYDSATQSEQLLPSFPEYFYKGSADQQFVVRLNQPKVDLPAPVQPTSSDISSIRHTIITNPPPLTKSDQCEANLLLLLHPSSQPMGYNSSPDLPSSADLTDPNKASKRANDYTGDFKKEFCTLLYTHSDARSEWDRFWRKHGCTGKRPCIKAYLAFCEQYNEFSHLRRNPRYRVLGTRTACKCSRTMHTFLAPKAVRAAPY